MHKLVPFYILKPTWVLAKWPCTC